MTLPKGTAPAEERVELSHHKHPRTREGGRKISGCDECARPEAEEMRPMPRIVADMLDNADPVGFGGPRG